MQGYTQPEDHVNWTPERKLEERDQAARIGQLESFVIKSPVFAPVAFVAGCAGLWGLLELAGEAVQAMGL